MKAGIHTSPYYVERTLISMQHEIRNAHDLLDKNGNLIEAGWCRQPILRYNPENIAFPKERFKEWHYYFAGDDVYGLGFSMANMGKFHRLSVMFMDFKNDFQVSELAFCPAQESVLKPPASPYEPLHFKNSQAEGSYNCSREQVSIKVHFKQFWQEDDLHVDLTLTLPEGDTMAHVMPFDGEPGLFFYCHKIACIRVSGSFTLGKLRYTFNPVSAFATQDWGRGIWPPKSNPYWGSASGVIDGKDFGFNIGYRYGNTQAATENVLFYAGKAHKLEDVVFHIPENETAWKKDWIFTSSDNRFEMQMHPVLDRCSYAPAGIQYGAQQHQVFGYFSGRVVLDDGSELPINNLFGFAEKVVNHW